MRRHLRDGCGVFDLGSAPLGRTLQCVRAPAPPARVSVVLDGVEETVLGPLYARAVDARSRLSLLRDERAQLLAERLDVDPSRLDRCARLAPVVRTMVFDELTRGFLRENAGGTVVELGAGLNTRFERVDNGRVRWFDVDMPRVTALRRRLLPVSGRRMNVAASILDAAWPDLVATTPGPHCFLLEAVLGYVACEQVRPLLAVLAARFPGAMIAFDIHPRWAIDVDGELQKWAFKSVCAIDIPRAIERWNIGLELVEVVSFLGHTARTPGPLRVGRLRSQTIGRPVLLSRFRARRDAVPP